MRWPWQRRERRDSGGDFSDAVVRLIEAQAAGSVADASSTAAVEAAAGALSRAFASAEVVGAPWVAQIFVAVLGASSYTFATASLSQDLADWIESHCRAFSFFWRGNQERGVRQPEIGGGC